MSYRRLSYGFPDKRSVRQNTPGVACELRPTLAVTLKASDCADGGAEWDAEMTNQALRYLAPRDKRRRLRASMARKVSLVEDFASEPSVLEPNVPMNRAQLRQWSDAKRKLWPWADPTLDRGSSCNGDLITRFHLAVGTIKARSSSHRDSAAQARLKRMEATIASLRIQNLALVSQLSALQENLDHRRH